MEIIACIKQILDPDLPRKEFSWGRIRGIQKEASMIKNKKT
jgi:hypothetical protein